MLNKLTSINQKITLHSSGLCTELIKQLYLNTSSILLEAHLFSSDSIELVYPKANKIHAY